MNIDKNDIKNCVTVNDVISHFGVKKEQTGLYICPVHNDKTGSLSIKNNFAYCFGCGFRGDSIHLYSTINNTNFITSLKEMNEIFLAGKYGHNKFSRSEIEARKNEAEKARQLKEYEENVENELFAALIGYIHKLEHQIENLKTSIAPDKERIDVEYLAQHTEKNIDTIVLIAKLTENLELIKLYTDLYFDIATETTVSPERSSKFINKNAKTRK